MKITIYLKPDPKWSLEEKTRYDLALEALVVMGSTKGEVIKALTGSGEGEVPLQEMTLDLEEFAKWQKTVPQWVLSLLGIRRERS